MAEPQLENGYTRIANEILEALARLNVPASERRIVDVIIRKTWGYIDNNGNKKIWDRIAYSQFSNYTGMSKQNVHRAVKGLLDKMVIERKPCSKRGDYEYRLQKDYDKWIGLSSKQTTKLYSKQTTKSTLNRLQNCTRNRLPQKKKEIY